MLNLKKTAVAVLALGSSAAFAGTMGPVCSAVNVTIPCESTAWMIGGKALYLQPTLAGSFLGTETTVTVDGTSAVIGRNPQYNWGFMLEGAYLFNTGNDINLNWYHLNRSTSRTFGAVGPFAADLGPVGAFTFTGGASSVSIDPHWDAVNLEFGQHVDFGEMKSIRFHGGAQYARLTNDSTFTGSSTVAGTAFGLLPVDSGAAYTVTTNPTYNGFGPRLGADMAYDWGNGLGIYANGAAALLAGSSKFNNTLTLDVDGAAAPITVSSNGSTTTIVPELEAKLGATYTYAMAQGDLTLDAGWMWVNYFNVIERTASALNTDNGDFGLQGPYIGLKWLGNVA